MLKNLKIRLLSQISGSKVRKNNPIVVLLYGLMLVIAPFTGPQLQMASADLSGNSAVDIKAVLDNHLATFQNNTLASRSILPESKQTRKMYVVATAYSSTPEETDADPFITASNKQVRDGIIANNMLPFGTKVRIPELYGNKIFTVEDRMNARKGDNQIDIWFPSHAQAENFGAEQTYIEIIGK